MTVPSHPSRRDLTASRLAPWLLCLALFGIYTTSQVQIQTDSLWSIPAAASILHEGNTDLDEFRPSFTEMTDYGHKDMGEIGRAHV